MYFVILNLVPAYFLSMCFYLEAICDDFESVFLDLDKSIDVGYAAMAENLILATNLQSSVVK